MSNAVPFFPPVQVPVTVLRCFLMYCIESIALEDIVNALTLHHIVLFFVLSIKNQGVLYNNQFNCLCGEIIRHNCVLCCDQCLSCKVHYGDNLISKVVLAISLKFICMTVTSICFPGSFSDLDLYFKFTLVLQKIKLYGVFWKFHFQASLNIYIYIYIYI